MSNSSLLRVILIVTFTVPVPMPPPSLYAAQKPADDVGNYIVTSLGNSLPRGAYDNDYRSHMQHDCFGIEISPDGRVYAGGANESGHAISVYVDGDLESPHIPKGTSGHICWNFGTKNLGAVSFDDAHMYGISQCGEFHKWTRTPPYERISTMIDEKIAPEEIVVKFNKLYMIANDKGDLQIRKLDNNYTVITSFTVPGAYDIAVENENSIWVSLGGSRTAANEIRRYDRTGNRLSGSLSGFGKLMGIAISFQGELLVCDDGPRKQVLFYDISDNANPKLTREFGEQGGIYNGNRGVLDNDLQFFDVQDAGTDSAGNIYTLFSTSSTIGQSGGNMIRAYKSDGTKLWELSNEIWTGCTSVLPSSDGFEIYGAEEVFRFDAQALPGPKDQQWKLYAISKDDITYPSDFREINNFPKRPFRGSAEIRELNGKRVIFRHGMYAETIENEKGYDFLVFEDRPSMISRYCGYLHGSGWAWYPDMEGNVWEGDAQGKIRMHTFSGFDAEGCLKYDSYEEYAYPAPMASVQRISYDEKNDVLYLSGYTPDKKQEAWGLAGKVLCRYDNWKAGNRTKRYEIDLPVDNATPSRHPKTMYVAQDYIFCVAVRPHNGISQKITVFDADNGKKVGTMSASDQYGKLGWVDITTGLIAFKRSNGEYIITVEDNAYAKNMVYRWCPDGGDCAQTTPPSNVNGVAVTNIIATSGKTYQADVLLTGKRQYIDRKYSFTYIPFFPGYDRSMYGEMTYIRTANDDKNASDADFLSFTVNKPVTVYVALDERISTPPSWLNDFKSTGVQLKSQAGTFNLLQKIFDAGTVTLGGNHSNESMYSVVIGPAVDKPVIAVSRPGFPDAGGISARFHRAKLFSPAGHLLGEVRVDRSGKIVDGPARFGAQSYLVRFESGAVKKMLAHLNRKPAY
ncbi:MAG: hypothetical protein GF350_06900 [Chitinivibrionales bacterium]|nr:hypothetical protein [Chitinivibrionales bacterium]